MKEVDVAIIGAGTAGLSARREVIKHTSNYVVIDDGPLGTTCARVGCMPSKVLIEAANAFHKRLGLKKMGIVGGESLTLDQRAMMAYVRSLRDRFVRAVDQDMQEWRSTHLLRKRAKFVAKNELDLGSERIRAKRIIIATGSKPLIPDEWQEHRKHLIDTDSFFELEELPARMAVVGTGAIGLEMGQALARLGVDVFAVTRERRSLGGLTDPEILEYATQKISEELPILTGGVQSLTERNGRLVVRAEERSVEVDKVLVAIGRKPGLAGLGLESLGLAIGKTGVPEFEPGTFRIKNSPIYIAGDVNGERPILHEAADEGRIAGYNSVRDEDHKFKRRVKLAITFSSPNIAIVGRTYREIVEEKIDFVSGEVHFEGQGRSIIKLEEKGLMKVYAERKTGRILGAEIFAPAGEHMAHLLAWTIDCDATVFDALAKPFYHPVVEEGLRTALRNLAKMVDTTPPDLELMRCEDPPVGSFAG